VRENQTGYARRGWRAHYGLSSQPGAFMPLPLSDDEAGRQILAIFVRHRVPANGTLKRIHFFDVRDSDFQRGINSAVARRWITVHHRDRYCYILTDEGYAAGRLSEAAARAAG
jgi:hypothetical protein